MMTGFSIEEVRIQGQGMTDAVVKLAAGFSLITGPSDSGKSLIADAINHVFGASGALRDVPEKEAYDRVRVQIRAYEDGSVYTLERAWGGGGVLLFEEAAANLDEWSQSRFLKDVSDSTDDSVSGFLLGLAGLQGKQLRVNATGGKANLSFRNLPIYLLVQEERIISKESPILSGQVTDVTKDESIFKCLLTGVDDGAIHTMPDKKVKKGLDAGRKEVLESLLADVQARIAQRGAVQREVETEIANVDEALANQTSYIQGLTSELDQRQTELKELWGTRQKREARREQVTALTDRFTLLSSHYDADIARLESTQESGRLLVQLAEGPCPLCGADPANHRHEGLLKSEDVEQLTAACSAEQGKIQRLKAELQKTLDRLGDEAGELDTTLSELAGQISSLQARIANEIEPTVRLTKDGFSLLIGRRKEAERIDGSL